MYNETIKRLQMVYIKRRDVCRIYSIREERDKKDSDTRKLLGFIWKPYH